MRRRAANLSATEQAPTPEATLNRWFADQDTAERRGMPWEWLTEVATDHYRTAYEVFAAENGPAVAESWRVWPARRCS